MVGEKNPAASEEAKEMTGKEENPATLYIQNHPVLRHVWMPAIGLLHTIWKCTENSLGIENCFVLVTTLARSHIL